MSASREKKERKDLLAQGMTERQKWEQAEAAKKRARTIGYTICGIVLGLALIALLVWTSGIIQRNTTALTVNGKKYSPADVSYFYYQSMNNAWYNEQYMVSLYEQLYDMPYEPAFNPSQDLRQQWVDAEETQSFHDYFIEAAKEALKQTTALYNAAMAEGYVMPQEDIDNMNKSWEDLKTQAASVGYSTGAYIQAVYGKYVTESVFRRNLQMSSLTSSYYTAKTGEIGNYTDEEMQAYYQENPRYLDTYTFERCYIDGTLADPVDANGEPLYDELGNPITATEEERAAALEAARAKAEAMTTVLRAGVAFETVAPDYVAEADVEAYLAEGYTHSVSLGEDLRGSDYGEWLTDPERKEGEAEFFENGTSGFYVVQYWSKELDNTLTVDFRHILFTAEQDADAEEPTEEQMEAARIKAQEAYDTWKTGDATDTSFGTLADEVSEDSSSVGNGGLYTAVTKGNMVANIDNWIFDAARQAGDTTVVENFGPHYFGWHVVYFQQHNIPAWRAKAESAKKEADTTAWLESVEAGYEYAEQSGMRYIQ